MRRYNARTKKVQPDDLKDPYMSAIEYKDMDVCRVCRNIYHNKRWVKDNDLFERLMKKPEKVSYTVCPSCRKIETHYFEGIVELKGDFLFEHKDEILNLIKNTEKRADYINPLYRIGDIEIDEKDKTIRLATTSADLAQRIGKNIEKAYEGVLGLSFSDDNKLVRVHWER